MLKTHKSINLEGYSIINENGADTQIVYLSASISTDNESNGTINTSILNQDLYYKHRKEVRKDMQDFNDKVFATEDELIAEEKKETSSQVAPTSGTITSNPQ